MNWPTSQSGVSKFPRTPAPAATKTASGMGAGGMFGNPAAAPARAC
jgi:hypothetical protein